MTKATTNWSLVGPWPSLLFLRIAQCCSVGVGNPGVTDGTLPLPRDFMETKRTKEACKAHGCKEKNVGRRGLSNTKTEKAKKPFDATLIASLSDIGKQGCYHARECG